MQSIWARSAANYYRTPGARGLGHQLKQGCQDAAMRMAKEMVALIPPDCMLVPIPGRSGNATTSLILAKELARLSGAPLVDAIKGRSREPVYEVKRRGEHIDSQFYGFFLCRSFDSRRVVLIDGVCDTGLTALAAAQQFYFNAELVTHSSHSEDSSAVVLKWGEERSFLTI